MFGRCFISTIIILLQNLYLISVTGFTFCSSAVNTPKNSFMNLFMVLGCASLVILSGCRQEKEATVESGPGMYVCRMKCEGDVFYVEAGKCPVSGTVHRPM